MIQVEDVYFSYGKNQVLNGVSFHMDKGEYVCILGANGCGKTTMLKAMLAFNRPSRGRITLDGEDVQEMDEKKLAKKVAYVPQYHDPPFPYTVRDVVLLGRTPHLGRTCHISSEDRHIAEQAMERLGIGSFAEKSYTELSGGQRQMVIIARALAQQPELLIMDEPTSGLDFGNQYLVLAQMRRLVDQGMGVLMVTHNPDHALYCGDRIIAMRNGRIAAMGSSRDVVSEGLMEKIYGMAIKVRDVGLGGDRNATVCIPVPEP